MGDVVSLWRGRGHSQVRDLDGMHDIRDPGPADEASTINAVEYLLYYKPIYEY